MPDHQPIVINGWEIFAHPLFLNQVKELLKQVIHLRQKYPQDYQKKNATKRLAAITKLAWEHLTLEHLIKARGLSPLF